jgi:hypothetical protein
MRRGGAPQEEFLAKEEDAGEDCNPSRKYSCNKTKEETLNSKPTHEQLNYSYKLLHFLPLK